MTARRTPQAVNLSKACLGLSASLLFVSCGQIQEGHLHPGRDSYIKVWPRQGLSEKPRCLPGPGAGLKPPAGPQCQLPQNRAAQLGLWHAALCVTWKFRGLASRFGGSFSMASCFLGFAPPGPTDLVDRKDNLLD